MEIVTDSKKKPTWHEHTWASYKKADLGTWIAGVRTGMGISKTDLAERIGVTYNTLNLWEKHGKYPSVDNFRAMLKALNPPEHTLVDLARLLARERRSLSPVTARAVGEIASALANDFAGQVRAASDLEILELTGVVARPPAMAPPEPPPIDERRKKLDALVIRALDPKKHTLDDAVNVTRLLASAIEEDSLLEELALRVEEGADLPIEWVREILNAAAEHRVRTGQSHRDPAVAALIALVRTMSRPKGRRRDA